MSYYDYYVLCILVVLTGAQRKTEKEKWPAKMELHAIFQS